MFYLYVCRMCGKEKEVMHSIKEDPEILCEEDDQKMVRVISGGTGTIFHGVGWAKKGTATAPRPEHTRVTDVSIPVFKDGHKPKEEDFL